MSQPTKRGKWDSSDDDSDNGKPKPKQVKKNGSKQAPKVEEIVPTAVEIPEIIMDTTSDALDADIVLSVDIEDLPSTETCEEPTVIESAQIIAPPMVQQKVEAPAVRIHNSIFDGCRSVDCYQRLNFIDQGTYGMVFKAKCRETGEIFALKQIKFGPETTKVGFPITALREINILLALQHPNIVRVKEMVVGSSIDKIYMVMEYCENDLKKCMQLQSFSTAEVSAII